jgi:hypothetical protein
MILPVLRTSLPIRYYLSTNKEPVQNHEISYNISVSIQLSQSAVALAAPIN